MGTVDSKNFVHKMSHDARNSIRALIELPKWIRDDLQSSDADVPQNTASFLDLMSIHASRLDNMVLDLVTFVQAGQPNEAGSRAFSDVLENVVSKLKIPDGFFVTRDIQCDQIAISESDLSVLLSALISNGIKHHHLPSGTVHVKTSQTDDHVIIEVSDDGPGIPVSQHSYVFDATTTLKSRDEVEGSGMGLATVKKIVEFYAGAVTVRNENGSVFCLRLAR